MLKCKRCGYEWMPKDESQKPKTCAKCKSLYWEKPMSPYWIDQKNKRESKPRDSK